MKVVLDTNVVVSGLLWDGPPRQFFRRLNSGTVELCTSLPLLAELTDVLTRPKFSQRIKDSGFTVDQLVELYGATTLVVRPRPVARIAPDPDDDVVIGTAVAAQAVLVVTGDRALLSVKAFEDVRLVSVAPALLEIDA